MLIGFYNFFCFSAGFVHQSPFPSQDLSSPSFSLFPTISNYAPSLTRKQHKSSTRLILIRLLFTYRKVFPYWNWNAWESSFLVLCIPTELNLTCSRNSVGLLMFCLMKILQSLPQTHLPCTSQKVCINYHFTMYVVVLHCSTRGDADRPWNQNFKIEI